MPADLVAVLPSALREDVRVLHDLVDAVHGLVGSVAQLLRAGDAFLQQLIDFAGHRSGSLSVIDVLLRLAPPRVSSELLATLEVSVIPLRGDLRLMCAITPSTPLQRSV